jgi:methyl-accepting chemotaxis protein
MEAIKEMLSDFKDSIKELNKEINQSNNQYSGLVVKLNSFIDELNRLRDKSEITDKQVTINTMMKQELQRLSNDIKSEVERSADRVKEIDTKVDSIKQEAIWLKASNENIVKNTKELKELKSEFANLQKNQTLRLGAEKGSEKAKVDIKWWVTTGIAIIAIVFTAIQFFSS